MLPQDARKAIINCGILTRVLTSTTKTIYIADSRAKLLETKLEMLRPMLMASISDTNSTSHSDKNYSNAKGSIYEYLNALIEKWLMAEEKHAQDQVLFAKKIVYSKAFCQAKN